MKMLISKMFPSRGVCAGLVQGAVAAALLAGCGGGGDPLSNPGNVTNPVTTGGASLAFPYFEKCIFPIFLKDLPITQNGVTSTNTCAGAGCHDSNTGTGGKSLPASRISS